MDVTQSTEGFSRILGNPAKTEIRQKADLVINKTPYRDEELHD